MTTPTPTLNPHVLGLAENAHRAILNRILLGTGLTYPRWVAFTVTAVGGDIVDHGQVVARVSGALKVEVGEVIETIDWLASSGLLETMPGDGHRLTEAGRSRYREIRGRIDAIMGRVYGDIPAEDLATAGRVLTLVTQRANAELAVLETSST